MFWSRAAAKSPAPAWDTVNTVTVRTPAAMTTLEVHTPHGCRTIQVESDGTSLVLADVLRRADLPLNTRCGQRGLCDGCLVELQAGRLIHSGTDQPVEAAEAGGLVRACEHWVPPGARVALRIPERSLLAHAPQVVTAFSANVSRAHDPLWQTIELSLAEIDRDGPFPEAVCRAVRRARDGDLPIRPGHGLTRLTDSAGPCIRLAVEYGGDHWAVHAGCGVARLGVAVDVGTTTVVAMLVDLADGEILGTASALNAQSRYGDNVLTRIQHCRNDKRFVGRLQRAVTRGTLRPLVRQLLADTGRSEGEIACFSIAGNTTMLHLVAGVDPSSIGVAPFAPAFLGHRILRSRALELIPIEADASRQARTESGASLREHDPAAPAPDPAVHLLPGAAAYIGADVLAGVISTGMAYQSETSLLVDLGTNGEIALKHGDRLLGCATAAGPAFEGAGLTCGVCAGRGAISHVRWKPGKAKPELEVIGAAAPIGLCGTAYVDFVAEARRAGLIETTGRFDRDACGGALVRLGAGRAYALCDGPNGKPIVVSEADIACLLQAKAAIAAGILCLLERAGLRSADVAVVYLAGGFGFHMDVANIVRCGLLPGFQPDQVRPVGNTSLAGAYLALMDSGILAEMKRIGARWETVELNLEPDFESRYIDQLSVPE